MLRPSMGICSVRGPPSSSMTCRMGMVWKSDAGYRSCCQPSGLRYWWKYPCWYASPMPTRGTPMSLEDFK